MKVCLHCSSELTGSQVRFCSAKHRVQYWYEQNRALTIERASTRNKGVGKSQKQAGYRRRYAADAEFRERRKIAGREYREANRSRFAERERLRKARRQEAFIEHVDKARLYEMYGGQCGICGEFISGEFHVDHVVPLSRGGLHGYINCQPAHPVCNQRKHNKLPTEMNS